MLINKIANKVLRESYEDIVDLVNVDHVALLLLSWDRLTSSDYDQLKNVRRPSSYAQAEQNRKEQLYDNALRGKGIKGLDAFLKALDKTADQYGPHAVLAKKLREKFEVNSEGMALGSKRSSQQLSEVCNNVDNIRAWLYSIHKYARARTDHT